MTKGLTAYYLLYKTYPVSSNETLLFHAAAGGVGQIFCQWAKSLGCKVIGTVGSDEKIDIAKKNGCDFVINYSTEDFAKKVLALTKGTGVIAPSVLDTALGMASGVVRKSILRVVSRECSQPILFLTAAEISGVEEIIEGSGETAGSQIAVVLVLQTGVHAFANDALT